MNGKKRKPSRRIVLLGLLCIALPAGFNSPAIAAHPAARSDEETMIFGEIPSVVGASKYEQKVTEAPSSVSIVTSAEIKKYGYRTLADILRRLRGFYVTDDRNYSYVGVRGFNRPGDYNTRVLLLVDGHRINDALYEQAYIGTDFILDVDLIDRVEVIRGPSSSLYGSSAFFAVVNVITRRARNLDGLEISGEAASFDTTRWRASYGNRFGGGLEAVLSGTHYESKGQNLFFPEFDDPATNNGVAEKKDGDRFKSLFSNVSFGDFNLQAAYSTREKGIPTGSYGTAFNDPRTRTTDERYYADLKYERVIDARTSFMGRIFYDWYRYDGDYAYRDDTVNPVPPFFYLNRDGGKAEWAGGEFKLSRRMRDRHRLTVGAEYRYALHLDQFNFNPDPFTQALDDKRRDDNWGIYFQDEVVLAKTLVLNAGARHDRYGRFGGTFNPRVALIYNPSGNWFLKFLYGRAFRAPNAYELYYSDGGVTQKSNPGLRPEVIRTYEIVFENYTADHYRVVAAGYFYRIDNLVSQQEDPADGLTVFRNAGEVRAKGIEFALERKWGSGLEGRVNYALQKTRTSDTGTDLSNSPRHLAKLNLLVPLAGEKLSAGMEVRYMSKRSPTPPHTTPAGAVTVANVTLFSARLVKGLAVSGSVYNLFDKEYGDPAAVEHPEALIPQDGRNYRLKFTYKY